MMEMTRFKGSLAAFLVMLFCLAAACTKEPSQSPAKPQADAGSPPTSTAKPQTEETQPAQPAQTAAAPSTSPSEAESSPDMESAARALVAKKWTGDLDGMIERRLIRVLTVYSKTGYFIDRGTQRGLIYESFQQFEEDLNKKLKSKHVRVHVAIVPVANDELIPALLDGRGDIVAAGKLVTEWRREKVDFTNPTRSHVSSIVVTGPGAPPIATVQDLGGKEVYLHQADISRQGLDQFNAMLAKAGKPPVKIRPAPEVLAEEDILEMVNAGIVQATVVHDYVAQFWQQVFTNIVLNKGAAVRTDGQIAMMVRKNSPQLMAELNGFLARYPEGSLKRNVLLQKYLKNTQYAKPATSKSEVAKFEQVVKFLRKYSDQYSLDYLLMGAQAYQESGLDQNRKSAVGAIGVMQLMPATGKDMKVGDIRQVEPNIHAGVKYIRFMMDQFYANEPMDTLNKGLFTFASYNAGPGRIKQLRELAAKRGLNPNVWFNNVELVAAEKIGRETVQYVSNIYKYYLAYKMLMEQYQERLKAKQEVAAKK
jgi:membrane-bound lytic murein transglycosylase MltF